MFLGVIISEKKRKEVKFTGAKKKKILIPNPNLKVFSLIS